MSKKPIKPPTLEAFEAATQAKALAEQRVAGTEQAFEQGRTNEQYQRLRAAQDELEFHTKVHALAATEHAEYERSEAARLGAEAEAQRLAQLAIVEQDVAKNIAESVAAAAKLARGLKVGWDLTIAANGLGSTGPNPWAYEVQQAINQALVAEGFSVGAIRIA